MMRQVTSFCRVCGSACGVRLTIDDNERITAISGDRDHPVSAGYACFKGLQAAETYHGPARLRHPLKRMPDGSFAPVPLEQALDEIAAAVARIRETRGNDAVALFKGSGSVMTTTARSIHRDFMRALTSRSFFSTFTIDQSAKQITAGRMGAWHAGKDHFDASDVILLFGTNPLVSHSTMGLLVSDPTKRLKAARARGLKLITIDPRFTETSRYADIALQPHAGEDPTIAAGLLHIILAEKLHDQDFCEAYAEGLDALERAVAPFTPAYVAKRAGIAADDLIAAARLFAGAGKRGAAYSGTGPDMSPRSNLAEHMIECLNVVCGRFKRAGDIMPNPELLSKERPWFAHVEPPTRSWERKGPGRIRGAGWFFGEKLASTLCDEILTPGQGQVRALIVDGGNPASLLPDKAKAIRALSSLDLLVAIEPFMTNTARLAHYILPPLLPYERADVPTTFEGMSYFADGWAQYTPAIITPPADSELVEGWYVFWAIAKRLGLLLTYGGKPLDMDQPPSNESLIALGLEGSMMPLEEVKRHPSGVAIDPADMPKVQPCAQEVPARFVVMPSDIAEELAIVAGEPSPDEDALGYRLIARRERFVQNTVGIDLAGVRARTPFNPAYLNPEDLSSLGLTTGDRVQIASDHGKIVAIAEADATLRRGTVAMSHGWGDVDFDADARQVGSSTNLLIADDRDVEPINAMVRMSGIPVSVSCV